MFNAIKTEEDIRTFLDKTNSLHDGYLVSVCYLNNGISKIQNGHHLNPEQTKLVLQILVTSLRDTIVEIEFESLSEWQIKNNQWDITDTTVLFDNRHWIIWSDDSHTSMDAMKEGSYAIAKSMKWRILE